jgi:hypothetical protein
MACHGRALSRHRIPSGFLPLLVAACVVLPRAGAAQSLTGAIVGTVKDQQGGVVPGALIRVTSPALIGGPVTVTTDGKGQ